MAAINQTSIEHLLLYAWIARIVERATLSIVVLLMAILLTIVLWKKIQSIDFSIAREEGQVSASVTFAMPVFLLLAVILFSYISFSHPISVKHDNSAVTSVVVANSKIDSSDPTTTFSVVGFSPSEDERLEASMALNALTKVSQDLQRLFQQGSFPTELKEHVERLSRIERALFSVKHQLAESGFTRDEISTCRAAISSNQSLSSRCQLYKQFTKGELE